MPPHACGMPTRLRILVTVHLLLAAAPLVMLVQSASLWFLPVAWSATSIVLGQLMLLAFWAGLGTSGRGPRTYGALIGSVYAAFWLSAPNLVSAWIVPNHSWLNWPANFGMLLVQVSI